MYCRHGMLNKQATKPVASREEQKKRTISVKCLKSGGWMDRKGLIIIFFVFVVFLGSNGAA